METELPHPDRAAGGHPVEPLIQRLNKAGARYLLIGGQAMRLEGMPRFSMDWDLYIPRRGTRRILRSSIRPSRMSWISRCCRSARNAMGTEHAQGMEPNI